MKNKLLFSLGLVAANVMFSTGASAAAKDLANGAVTILDCTLLAEDVRISPSNNVLVAYNCGGTAKAIQVATCHTDGRTAERTVQTPCDDDDTTTAIPACTDPLATQVTSGASIFTARSNGGKVQPAAFANGTVCDAASVKSKIPDLNI
ncbi:hypothetical protein [Stutzerimonas xanthomarina]|uniref:CVNH domain-containing protein n=2 Tax=Stutzerimonas xanthomarina TaxID=271420 RepID=A0A1M5K2Q9_9GAMM|nr:hypothetical protein [Stutzerimonas xanthomarina]MCP9339756.1 hypothetical protein [Stutzerimonas xanthomarina]SEI04132.1 hypothetical protein SAMN05216535_3640 [Stutzerimonas xanthomarina]SHG47024.1 hypothetical protein SAMN02744645_0244 [Stutzerimonas xanthomarina DSM 18231]